MLHGHSSYLSRSSMLDRCLLRCGQLDCEALLAPVARLPTAVSIVFLRMICIGRRLGDRSKPEIGFPLRSWGWCSTPSEKHYGSLRKVFNSAPDNKCETGHWELPSQNLAWPALLGHNIRAGSTAVYLSYCTLRARKAPKLLTQSH